LQWISVAAASIINWPLNQVVIIGDSAHFACISNMTEDDIWWQFYSPGNNQATLISKGDVCRHTNRHTIVSGTKGAQLRISSVQSNDSGLYVCSEKGKNKRGAQLIVLCKCTFQTFYPIIF